MKYGLDMAYPPSTDQAQRMHELGYTFCIVYIGGPRAMAHTEWHQVDGLHYPVRDLVPYFPDGFLPTYVGRNVPWDRGTMFTAKQGGIDGADANTLTGSCGFGPTTPIVLDVEYGTYELYPAAVLRYIAGFVTICNAVGHPIIVYGDLMLMNILRQGLDVDGKWGADQLLSNRVNAGTEFWARFDPGSPPPWMIWQCGSGTVDGVGVDYNTATDDCLLAQYG